MNEDNLNNCSTERAQSAYLFGVWVVVTIIAMVCQFLAIYIFPDDNLVLSRALVLNLVPDFIYSAILMTALVLFDFITPGDTLKCAASEPLPGAILLGSFVIALALVMAAL
jgi:hypothetical protein